MAADTLSSGLRTTAVDSVHVPIAPKSEGQADIPAKVTPHSAQVSNSVAADAAWQKGNAPAAASAPAPPSTSASPVATASLEVNTQPAAGETTWQKDAPPEAGGIQPSGKVSADSGEGATHGNLTDTSTSGQGKSGQQSGTGPGNDSGGVATLAPSLANNLAPDSTTNLLAAHAPSVAANHIAASSPPSSPSSSPPPTTLSAWQNYDGGPGKIVRSASLTDSAGGAEMHVELRTGALGPMDVHAILHEGTVGAEIHVQGQEAHTLLAAGLPSLERALGERNLRVENIAVYQDHAGGGMSGGEKQNPHSGSPPAPPRQALSWENPPKSSSAASGSLEDEELANPAAGLSVQA